MIGFSGVCHSAIVSGVCFDILRLAFVSRSKYSGFSPVGSNGVMAGLAWSNSCLVFGYSVGIMSPLY